MAFTLNDAGHRCYSLIYQGEHVGAVFTIDDHERTRPWVAMLHDGWAKRGSQPPGPFTELEHRFGSLEELRAWLGIHQNAPGADEAIRVSIIAGP